MQAIDVQLKPMTDAIEKINSEIKTLKNSLHDRVSIILEISLYENKTTYNYFTVFYYKNNLIYNLFLEYHTTRENYKIKN